MKLTLSDRTRLPRCSAPSGRARTKLLAVALAIMVTGAVSAQLTMSHTANGNVQGQLFGDTDPQFTGNFVINVSGLPAGAIMLRAFLYGNEWNNITNATASFNGNNLGSIAAFANDSGLYTYRWDVTALPIFNGPHTVAIAGPLQLNGAALALIYQEPGLPIATVVLNDGALNVGDFGPETVQTSIAGVPAGSAGLSIYTQGDDSGSTGEQVLFNNAVVGGPLDGNLGTHASILNMNVTALATNDVAAVNTTNDQYGWHVAMLQTNPIPEPATLLALGLGSLALLRRRKKSQA